MCAEITKITNTRRSGNNGRNSAEDDYALLEPDHIIQGYVGPAFILDEGLNVTKQNADAQFLVDALNDRDPGLLSQIMRAFTSHVPAVQKITLGDIDNLRHFDIFTFPTYTKNNMDADIIQRPPTPHTVLVLAREVTLEQNLTNALVQSRQMFKDLVSCSSDFAWETDQQGNFRYISPNGALGFSAHELNNRPATKLLPSCGEDEIDNPFTARQPLENAEFTLRRTNNGNAHVLLSAVPIRNNQGIWLGTRGVCRDITEQREHEAALQRLRSREQLLARIVTSMREIRRPEEMFAQAARAIFDVIQADHCFIFMRDLQSPSQHGTPNASRPEALMLAHLGPDVDPAFTARLEDMARQAWNKNLASVPQSTFRQVLEDADGTQDCICGLSQYQNGYNGAIFILRKGQPDGWSVDEQRLMAAVAGHLAIAIDQHKTHSELHRLSRTDELTALMNRRAFSEEMLRRLALSRRHGSTGALLYIDLDNFKAVNDQKGHGCGDDVLRRLGELLQHQIRASDLAVRLGGDEFALWLDDVDEQGATLKAHALLALGTDLRRYSGETTPPLSLSVGVCLTNPHGEQTLNELLEAADTALYDVKKNKKGTLALVNTASTPHIDRSHPDVT